MDALPGSPDQTVLPSPVPTRSKLSSTDPHILTGREILTDNSELSSESEVEEVFHPIMAANQMATDFRKLKRLRGQLLRLIEDFQPDDVDARISVLERDLREIRDVQDDYCDAVDDYLEDYESEIQEDPVQKRQWELDKKNVRTQVREHANSIRRRKESLYPVQVLSPMEKNTIEYHQKSLEIQVQSLKEQQQAKEVQQQEKIKQDEVLAETESNTFLAECRVLEDLMPDETWEEMEDEDIGKAMREMSKWQDQITNLERCFSKFENLSLKHNFSEDKKEAIRLSFQEKKDLFEVTKAAVLKEDADRGLFTLEPVKSDIIKYPILSGLPSEDFVKFKETMIQRFKENKVKRKEQVAKLRECLRGAALARVPDGIKYIEEAFKRLDEAFGNPSKVMAYQLRALEELGTIPPEKLPNGHINYSKRIEWFLKLEVILSKIIELGERSTKLAHEAFGAQTYRKLWSRFPPQTMKKLARIKGEDEVRMQGILEKIQDMRQEEQMLDDECGNPLSSKRKGDGVVPSKALADVFFRQPQRYEECRICVHLSATGNHQNLFENHLSTYPTGCPKFIEATMEKRKTLVEKIKICPQCFHPDIVFNKDHLKDCQFTNKKKNAYICTVPSCKTHMWICVTHKRNNQQQMEKFKTDLLGKGLRLAYTSLSSFTGLSRDAYTQAVKKMKNFEKKKKKENRVEMVPVPDGEPLFLFHPAQGKDKDVNVFFDSGCSHAVFQADIPFTQLKAQLVAKGPFTIGGVGGLTTVALDEWLVQIPRADGRTQLVQGLTVPQVTCEFPVISLKDAVEEVKADKPTNTALQSCRVPPSAGGVVDVLLGIKYSSIFPIPVHTLESGLTIYKSQLASHGGKYDCCIGGPHQSFTVLTSLAGGASQLLSHFVEGLKAYRQWGPPKITSICMSTEEISEAMMMNAVEGEMREFTQLREVEQNKKVESGPLVQSGPSWSKPVQTGQSWSKPVQTGSGWPKPVQTGSSWFNMVLNEPESQAEDGEEGCCIHCPAGTVPTALVSNDERVRDLKRFYELHESGLEVEYRCPACRECADCKSSERTEKISLREECEQFEIEKSVHLDFINKKIQCTLPLVGKERDFLSCNRDRAMKILKQQLIKYYKDSETKEIILKAFAKLFDRGHAKLVSNLSQDEAKEVQYHIPWRVVFSNSPTTPCRPVLDASSRTSFRKDKTGGRSLNDLVAKGKIETLNLVKVLTRFLVGREAFTGDLTQFYNACKLGSDQWNLQRFLWVEDLNPDGEVLEAVITTLIYGVRSVSAQSEFALGELAKLVKDKSPVLARLLVMSRYVDDIQESKATEEECRSLMKEADDIFSQVGLTCKAWTVSGSTPPEIVSKDGMTVGVAGFGWFPETDILELKIPRLHFGKIRRGRLPDTVRLFEGSEKELEEFVPKQLSRRQVTSKLASIWDILGKLAPIMTGLKLDLRETFKETDGWDTAMPPELREKWMKNFLLIEKLRGLKYQRAVMPVDAVDTKLRLLTGVDAAKTGLMMGCWGGFLRKNGLWSNKLILGRSLLARSESIPKDELESLCAGSNMAWVVKSALQDWVEQSILFSDSTIALCWLTSEKLRLSLYHRNRVIQIRRGTSLEEVYHVKTEFNPADCGTRPEKVKPTDVGPDSRWEVGDQWMTLDIQEAVKREVLKPATSLRVAKDIDDEEINDFKKGLMFGDKEELMGEFTANVTDGKKISMTRIQKLQERADYSEYLVLPTKHSFPSTVRIYGYVMTFVSKARKGRRMLGKLLSEAKIWFTVFKSDMMSTGPSVIQMNLLYKEEGQTSNTKVLQHFSMKMLVFENTQDWKKCLLSDEALHLALLYLFRKGSAEVKQFNSHSVVQKIAIERDGILLSKGRLLDGMNFVETGELGDLDMGTLGVKVNTPVLDRFSPLSYCIAQYVHWSLSKHRGIETNNRMSMEHVSIIQGMNLYREIAEECLRCKMKRKKFLEVPMGPVAQDQLVLAPPFYITMIDLFGPVESYVPGFERHTRNRQVLESKMYIMVAVCVTTKVVNLQALEGRKTHEIIDGFTRLCAEVGVPTKVHVDDESGAVAGFKAAELDILDLQHKLRTQFGISFETCPVSGHFQHGLAERIIRSIQETFDDQKLKKKRLHSMGWQTFCKLAENAYNNLPIGYSHSRYQDNTELLKILTPNMLRVGRINSRALQGPVRLPTNKKELLQHVEKLYGGWFKVFKETVVPRLIQQPKWFKIDQDLKEKDIVYFEKRESALGSSWTVGEVDQVIVGRDGLIRRAVIKYFNASENDPEKAKYHPQFTDRAVRSLIKLWSIDDTCLSDDLAELQERVDGDNSQEEAADPDGEAVHSAGEARYCQGVLEDGVVSSTPSHMYVDEDGCLMDLSPLTSSCDVSTLLVYRGREMCTNEVNKDYIEVIDEIDTLYKVMVSKRLNLN